MNKFGKKTIIASLFLCGVNGTVLAQIAPTEQEGITESYQGLKYPRPNINNKSINVNNMEDLLSNKISSAQAKNTDNVSEMRSNALREVANSLGASSGLAHRMNQIRKEIEIKSLELDKMFDFRRTTIDNGVLAPVLTEGLSNYSQNSDDEIRISDKIYKIEVPAKFVSVYPTWRSYLKFSYPTFDSPDKAYLPQNDTEKRIWDESIKEGWKLGIDQANRIFESSYAKLERDYLGMIKYKILLEEGIITPTIVAKQNLGVTGGGKEMAINDQVFRITDHSSLNPNQKDWKVEYPVTNQNNGKLK